MSAHLAAKDRLIVALDVPDLDSAQRALGLLANEVRFFKVGLELFTVAGPAAAKAVTDAGCKLFLDLKICDIPNTARAAVRAAALLGAELVTVHATGGPAMIKAARDAANEAGAAHGRAPKILAVTVLTSFDQASLARTGLCHTPDDRRAPVVANVVRHLGKLAMESGAHGLVASPAEVPMLRTALGKEPILVTPGVRPAGSRHDDQARVATPREAVDAGADYLVVGRPILLAHDPLDAVRAIHAELGA